MTNHFTEMEKLEKGLRDRDISYEVRLLFDGMQILCDNWDAICYEGSGGHELGLIEVMGLCKTENGDNVIGWLTAENVLQLVDHARATEKECEAEANRKHKDTILEAINIFNELSDYHDYLEIEKDDGAKDIFLTDILEALEKLYATFY